MSSKIKLDRLLVVDFEATCDEDPNWTKENAEIIEVGIVPLELASLEIRRDLCYRTFVKPKKTKVSNFCKQLTGIDQIDVEKAPEIEAVFKTIQDIFSKNAVWGSWGKWDLDIVVKTCKLLGIENPFPAVHYNLKNLDSVMNGFRKEFGLLNALKNDNMSFEGVQHRALDDAMNTALKIQKTLKRLRK